MTSLLKRLREATGADREIDILIQRTVNPDRDKYCYAKAMILQESARANGLTNRDDACRRDAYFDTPQYTGSVDAALTLVPTFDDRNIELIMTLRADDPEADAVFEESIDTGPHVDVKTIARGRGTLAMALCIASLLARGMKEEE